MKAAKRARYRVTVLFILGLLITSNPANGQRGQGGQLDFSSPPKWAGRPLTEVETANIRHALMNIGTPPPAVITFSDSAGASRTISCSEIAMNLVHQLLRGDIQAETLNTGNAGETFYGGTLSDGKATPWGDKLNLDAMLLAGAAEDPQIMQYLEVILLHEYIHKTQVTATTTGNAREIEAFAASLAYMDSLGFATDDGMRQESFEAWQRRKFGTEQHSRAPLLQSEGLECAFIHFDTTGAGPSYLTTFRLGDTGWHQFSLSSWRPSDMILFSHDTPLPPGHFLAVLCGNDLAPGTTRLTAYDVFQSQVVSTYIT